MVVNFYGSRSFEDLSQYPIMPWPIANYKTGADNLSQIKRRDFKSVIGNSQDKVDLFKSKYYETVQKQPKLSPYLDQAKE